VVQKAICCTCMGSNWGRWLVRLSFNQWTKEAFPKSPLLNSMKTFMSREEKCYGAYKLNNILDARLNETVFISFSYV